MVRERRHAQEAQRSEREREREMTMQRSFGGPSRNYYVPSQRVLRTLYRAGRQNVRRVCLTFCWCLEEIFGTKGGHIKGCHCTQSDMTIMNIFYFMSHPPISHHSCTREPSIKKLKVYRFGWPALYKRTQNRAKLILIDVFIYFVYVLFRG